jgi:hypothetical protein
MKKLFIKPGSTLLLSVVFLLSGLFFCTTSADAQTVNGTQQTVGIKTNKQWLTENQATTALQTALTDLTNLINAGPSNPTKVKAQIYVYNEILARLSNGASTPDASTQGYYHYAPNAGSDTSAFQGLTGSDWSGIYNDMITLLTNP